MARVQHADAERPLTPKYEKVARLDAKPRVRQPMGDTNALQNWHNKMQQRKKQQGFLSSEYIFVQSGVRATRFREMPNKSS